MFFALDVTALFGGLRILSFGATCIGLDLISIIV